MDMDEVIATNEHSKIECINKLNLTGSVVHKFRPRPDVIVLTVAVKGRDIHEADYPNVTFYGETMADSIDKNIEVGERNFPRMRIEGCIQTTRRESPDGVRYFQNAVGTNIYRVRTQMEQLSGRRGLGSHKAESANDVCLLGQVTNVHPITRRDSDRIIGATVTIRTMNDGRTNFPRVTCFSGMTSRALALNPGDVVCMTGFLETENRTREDGTRVRYESIIATEIVKVDAEDGSSAKSKPPAKPET